MLHTPVHETGAFVEMKAGGKRPCPVCKKRNCICGKMASDHDISVDTFELYVSPTTRHTARHLEVASK
eukprot:g51871.t1